MPNCFDKCPTISGSDFEEIWDELRWHYGPRSMSATDRTNLYTEDMSEFVDWANNSGRDSFDAALFGKWLNWKFSVGTTEYGNLSQRKRDHEGITNIFCPYDSNSTILWTAMWLGISETEAASITKSDHGKYYMKVSNSGSSWGFKCTSDTCPYFLNSGNRYFHV